MLHEQENDIQDDNDDDIDTWNNKNLTPLMQAALAQDEAQVRQLIAQGASVDRIGTRSETALMCAVWKGAANIVRLLLDAGADINLHGWFGDTALHISAIKGSLDIMVLLLERGSYVDAQNKYGATPLFEAAGAWHRCIECIQVLLDWGARVNVVTYRYKESIMEQASRSGNIEIVRLLLDNGTDVNLGRPLSRAVSRLDELRRWGPDRYRGQFTGESRQQVLDRYEQIILLLKQAGANI